MKFFLKKKLRYSLVRKIEEAKAARVVEAVETAKNTLNKTKKTAPPKF